MAGPRKKLKGQKKGKKPSLESVLRKMAWPTTESGEEVGVLSNFLREVGLLGDHPAERAATFNKLLAEVGHTDRIWSESVLNLSGKDPWVAYEDTYRVLYNFV